MSVHDRYQQYQPDQRELFDALIAEEWHTYASAEWDTVRRHEVAELFRLIQPQFILDAGCGCGFHDLEMANYPFVQQVDGIDYSRNSIAKANVAYPHAKVRRWVCDFLHERLSMKYDAVVSFQVFEHLAEPGEYFRFVRDTLIAGGHAAIFTPNVARLSNRIRAWRRLPPALCDPQHFREYQAYELVAQAADHGFSWVCTFGYGLSGTSRWLQRLALPTRLSLGRLLPAIANGMCIVLRAPV